MIPDQLDNDINEDDLEDLNEDDDKPADATRIDPDATYSFGGQEVSGYDLLKLMVQPQQPPPQPSNDVNELKAHIARLEGMIAAKPEAKPEPQQPTAFEQWSQQRTEAGDPAVENATLSDLIGAMRAMSTDFGKMVQGVAAQVPSDEALEQKYEGIMQKHQNVYQSNQQKLQTVQDIVNTYVQTKAEALGLTAEELMPSYQPTMTAIQNSTAYLMSNNLNELGQYVRQQLQQQSDAIAARDNASSVARKRGQDARKTQLARQSQQRIADWGNPNRKEDPLKPYRDKHGIIDDDALLQGIRQQTKQRR